MAKTSNRVMDSFSHIHANRAVKKGAIWEIMKKMVSGSSFTTYMTKMKFRVPTPQRMSRAGTCSLATPSRMPTLLDRRSMKANTMLKKERKSEYSAAVIPCVVIKYCATPLFTVKNAWNKFTWRMIQAKSVWLLSSG